mmetsp:Transcript_78549/g.156139  ORF Transcript_78549/g.156139 Transcript_78549/m.156139 type:complete len:252 (+) Transcript_78549:1535-2290(+)
MMRKTPGSSARSPLYLNVRIAESNSLSSIRLSMPSASFSKMARISEIWCVKALAQHHRPVSTGGQEIQPQQPIEGLLPHLSYRTWAPLEASASRSWSQTTVALTAFNPIALPFRCSCSLSLSLQTSSAEGSLSSGALFWSDLIFALRSATLRRPSARQSALKRVAEFDRKPSVSHSFSNSSSSSKPVCPRSSSTLNKMSSRALIPTSLTAVTRAATKNSSSEISPSPFSSVDAKSWRICSSVQRNFSAERM